MSTASNRRPVGLRSNERIQQLARAMHRRGWSPNSVSILSIAFATAAAACFALVPLAGGWLGVLGLLLAPVFVAGRGLCNLVDGLIAVEGNCRTASGELFNDLPDRVSDLLLYASAGYAVGGSIFGSASAASYGVAAGWAAAALAIMVAYVRFLGGAMGAKQYFIGPMAKTHRMAVLCAGSIAAAVELALRGSTISLLIALAIIIIGCVVTVLRRAARIVRELEAR